MTKISKHGKGFKHTKVIIILTFSGDRMQISVKKLPNGMNICDEYYNEKQLREFLDIKGSKCADDYGHNIERKTRDIMGAITQLEETAERLEKKGKLINKVMIICDGLDDSSSRLFERKKDKKTKQRLLFDKILRKEVLLLNKYKIEVFYNGGVK